jgi:DNA repair exonuclease SbcCD ATPase subunit
MTIKLETLEFDWYFSYGSGNSINFTENTVTQILGPNGYGKSSIPLVLEEICFNKNSKGISKAEIPNRYGPGGTWGRLTFTKDDDTYVIEVERKASIKVKLSKNGIDISSHTATGTFKIIEELFGNDFKTFSQLVYQNTNTSLQFLSATDTNRKKFLIDLLQLDEYVKFFEIFKDAAKEHSSSVSKLEASMLTVENWLKANRLTDTTPMELKSVDIDVFEDEKRAAGLSAEVSNIRRTNTQIAQNNKYRELLKTIDIDAINALPAEEPKSYDEEQRELGEIQGGERLAQTHLDKLKRLADTCPTCEQDIDTQFKTNLILVEEEKLVGFAERKRELTSIIASIKDNNKNHAYKAEKIKEWEELYRSVNHELPEELFDKEELEAELSNLTIRISNARHELKKLQEHNDTANRHNSRIQVIMEQAQEFENQLKSIDSDLAEQREHLSDLELLKKSFSTNGLLAYKIENLVKDLESLTNDYLAELSDGRFTIDFSVVSDKLNVNITDNGKIININALSSGELARVNTSTLLALRSLMNSISKSQINVLFLDEVISVLDEQGKEKLVEVLLHEDLNTYIVSHSWTHPLLSKMEVIKEDNISRIEYA